MATQIFQNSYLTRTEILKPIQKMVGEQLKWPAGSQFIVGGTFYQQATDLTINLTSLSANTLYMVYAVMSGGVITGITYSTNVNSVGPVGATAWKLIGAFYSNGLASPAFGGLVNISGSPRTDWITAVPTIAGSPTASGVNALSSSRWSRNGDSINFQFWLHMGSTGTAGSATGATWSLPNLPNDFAKLARGVSQTVGTVLYWNTTAESHFCANAAASGGVFIETSAGGQLQANTILANYQIALQGFMPISGWSNTPLIDL